MAQGSEYWFACSDLVGRRVRGAVLVWDGELVVVLPEPGSASFGQLSHQHLCATLRAILVDAVQAGRRAAEGFGTVPCRAVATLHLLLMSHSLDRRGRCRSGCGAEAAADRDHPLLLKSFVWGGMQPAVGVLPLGAIPAAL